MVSSICATLEHEEWKSAGGALKANLLGHAVALNVPARIGAVQRDVAPSCTLTPECVRTRIQVRTEQVLLAVPAQRVALIAHRSRAAPLILTPLPHS